MAQRFKRILAFILVVLMLTTVVESRVFAVEGVVPSPATPMETSGIEQPELGEAESESPDTKAEIQNDSSKDTDSSEIDGEAEQTKENSENTEPEAGDSSGNMTVKPSATPDITDKTQDITSTLAPKRAPEKTVETVTVSFQILNENYTHDPGSGSTHITAETPFEGGDLTYTQSAGRYAVSGTGVLCSYTLPAGSSLEGNGLSLPKIIVTNIGDNNTYTYQSPYSWVDFQGTAFNVQTPIEADTVLSLYLYQAEEDYSLNFVCGEEGHSITYILGRYPSATFTLGQSVSEAYIPSSADINANYHTELCTHGKDHGETFLKWQLKVAATGEMVDFGPGVPITAEYVENGNHSIKVYAVWTSSPVVATFDYGDGKTDSREYSAGSPLGSLPTAEAPEGFSFLGWEYTDSEGNLQYATADTLISADTTYTARFIETQTCTLTFYDVKADGSSEEILLEVESGTPLSQAIASAGGAGWTDNTPIENCLWYTIDKDGLNVPVAADAPVTGDMELYTYSYELSLTLKQQDAEPVTLTIFSREGQPMNTADFVLGGVDFSTYSWTEDGTDGTELDLQALIADGITEDIAAYSENTERLPSGIINFYIAIDDEWVLLDSREMSVHHILEYSGGRYCLTAAQLESVYGAYGFSAAALKRGDRLFPHTSPGDDRIWANVMVRDVDGILYSPMLSNSFDCDVYYLPNASTASFSGPREDFVKANSFYSILVSDPGHKVYAVGESLPVPPFTLTGDDASVTVKTAAGVDWQCIGSKGSTVKGIDNGDGTVTFNIENIDQPYIISPSLEEDEFQVLYDINLPYEPSDPEYESPTIGGGNTHTVIEQGTEHTVLAPSITEYFYSSGKYLGIARFQGWAVMEKVDTVLQPGQIHTISQDMDTLTLVAQWETELGGNSGQVAQSSMVNFFVALTAVPEGGASWTSSIHSNFFTNSVFTSSCNVTGEAAMNQHLYESSQSVNQAVQYIVMGATSGNDLNQIHDDLTGTLTNGLTKTGAYDGKEYTFQVSFPTDEEVLRHVRAMIADGGQPITLNGKTVYASDLTSANFTIKWHVFKFDTTDGWHIDGVLVAKTGHMRITKTFSGDQDVVKKIKEGGYSITVASQPHEGFTPPNPGTTLTLDNFSSYDSASDTYTWYIPVDQYLDYKISEVNYTTDNSYVKTAARYNVYNSKFSAQNTGGWQEYPGTFIVTGQSSAQSTQQLTVSFINTYTKPGTMSLIKVDALTHSFMPDVSFTIEKVNDDDGSFILYDLGSSHYTVDSSAAGAKPTVGNTITTDASGQAFLHLGTGTFIFKESVPNGYDDPGDITVVLVEDSIDSATAANSDQSKNRIFTQINDGMELQVNNYSRVVPLTVEKVWTDGENTPVTLQLYYNDQHMATDFNVELKDTTWSHTFSRNVPLYIGGDLVKYSLLETEIGDWSYSEEYGGDGYRYYDVTYSSMEYRDANGKPTDKAEEAASIYLKVSNRRSTGGLSFSKVDENNAPLPGAVFYLYPVNDEGEDTEPGPVNIGKDSDGFNVLEGLGTPAQAVSDTNGLVSFGNVPTGNYYLIEHSAPENYKGTDAVYLVELQGTGFTMKQWDGNSWVTTGKTVVNTLQAVEVNIEKIVAGSFGILSREFDFTVQSDRPIKHGSGYTLSQDGKTARFTLGHKEDITLTLEPGSVITISETNAQGYSMSLTSGGVPVSGNQYTVPSDGTKTVSLQVTNTKNATVDTGIVLDSLPYLVILGLAAAGGVLLVSRRKRRDD